MGGLTFGRSVDEEGVKESARGAPPCSPRARERDTMARSVCVNLEPQVSCCGEVG